MNILPIAMNVPQLRSERLPVPSQIGGFS